ncbi:MAG: S41 family peptidase, partial [Bacteroidales bacterium]|nr:S41 family peptidase [Bacteroidales bacterium]
MTPKKPIKYVKANFFLHLIIVITFLTVIPNTLVGQEANESVKKITRTIQLIDGQYVDTVNMSDLVVEAIKAMVTKLDPHSKYQTVEESIKNQESLNGSFGGVGVNYQILRDTLLVLSVVDGGPSQIAGIQPGDKILAADSVQLIGNKLTFDFISKNLRGAIGTTTVLKILRKSENQIKEIKVTRGAIPIKTIDAGYLMDKNTGYIKINGFSFTTMSEFKATSSFLQMQGMKNLILDLRGNPGGLMISSINLADEFLEPNQLIVYTEGAHYKREDYLSKGQGDLKEIRLIVLVDELSASASEIFAGAMQDLDRGLIVGRRSYGKGLVGRNFPLPDGSSLRLTTGHYYTPSGRCIQKSYSSGIEAYKNDLAKRSKNGELTNKDSIQIIDSLIYKTKNGRNIYGGGGIIPDVFIGIDTNRSKTYFDTLMNKGIINAAAGHIFDLYLSELKRYQNLKHFESNFKIK